MIDRDTRNHDWWHPLPAPERERSWQATRERLHAAIQRTRLHHGYEDAQHSVLGDHLLDGAVEQAGERRIA